jgi:hypothetical protein
MHAIFVLHFELCADTFSVNYVRAVFNEYFSTAYLYAVTVASDLHCHTHFTHLLPEVFKDFTLRISVILYKIEHLEMLYAHVNIYS